MTLNLLERKDLQRILQKNRWWMLVAGNRIPREITRDLETHKFRVEHRPTLLHNHKFLKNAKLTEYIVVASLRA